jgi:hypothetical protein
MPFTRVGDTRRRVVKPTEFAVRRAEVIKIEGTDEILYGAEALAASLTSSNPRSLRVLAVPQSMRAETVEMIRATKPR